MCGRLACYLDPGKLCKACTNGSQPKQTEFCSEGFYNYKPSYNVSPSMSVPVLVDKSALAQDEIKQEFESQQVLVPMRWGIIPPWSKDDKGSLVTHNARLETIVSSKLYGPIVKRNYRCAVVCNGYYEWQTTKPEKQPYYIHSESQADSDKSNCSESVLKLAAIFSKQVDQETEKVKFSCSVITKESDSRLSWLHHRMPILLNTEDDVNKWIDLCESDWEESYEFIKTYDENATKHHFEYHPVNKTINKSTNNDPSCIVKFTLKRKNTLDSWLKSSRQKTS